MDIGIPREVKDHEYRVAIVPSGVRTLVTQGHRVFIERGAGLGSGISNEAYAIEGAILLETPEEVYGQAQMIVKVKEPLPEEVARLRPRQLLITFLHLAANPELARHLLDRSVTAVAYETVEESGRLPILIPMSEIAGRLSVFIGAHYLQKMQGGEGILLGGVPGVEPGRVLVLGAGTVGRNAIQVAVGLGAEVIVISPGLSQLRELDALYRGRIVTLAMNSRQLEEETKKADIVVGAVLVPGAKTPALITKEMVSRMKKGSVIVDVSIDQGGCAETSRPTTHSHPVYAVDGVIHYAVANIPGIVPRTATFALCNSTISYIEKVATLGMERSFQETDGLRQGLNISDGKVRHPVIAASLNLPCVPYH